MSKKQQAGMGVGRPAVGVFCGDGPETQKLLDITPKEVRQHCQNANVMLAVSSEYSHMGNELVWCMGKHTVSEHSCEELCVQQCAASSYHAYRSSTKLLGRTLK